MIGPNMLQTDTPALTFEKKSIKKLIGLLRNDIIINDSGKNTKTDRTDQKRVQSKAGDSPARRAMPHPTRGFRQTSQPDTGGLLLFYFQKARKEVGEKRI